MRVNGAQVRYLRLQRKESLTELAKRAEIQVDTLDQLEAGTIVVRDRVILRLARALGVEPGALIAFASPEDASNETGPG